MATREAIRADLEIGSLMLGVEPQVAELLSGLQITDIDRMAQHQFQRIEPRWLDRTAIWRSLLLSAENRGSIQIRQFDAHCLQLLTWDLLPDCHSDRSKNSTSPQRTT